MRENINPNVLHIQIFPMIDNINPEFRKKWESNLQLCTSNMMQLLIVEYKIQTGLLEKDIDEVYIYTKLQAFLLLRIRKKRLRVVSIRWLLKSYAKKKRSSGGTRCPSRRVRPTGGNPPILLIPIRVRDWLNQCPIGALTHQLTPLKTVLGTGATNLSARFPGRIRMHLRNRSPNLLFLPHLLGCVVTMIHVT